MRVVRVVPVSAKATLLSIPAGWETCLNSTIAAVSCPQKSVRNTNNIALVRCVISALDFLIENISASLYQKSVESCFYGSFTTELSDSDLKL